MDGGQGGGVGRGCWGGGVVRFFCFLIPEFSYIRYFLISEGRMKFFGDMFFIT